LSLKNRTTSEMIRRFDVILIITLISTASFARKPYYMIVTHPRLFIEDIEDVKKLADSKR